MKRKENRYISSSQSSQSTFLSVAPRFVVHDDALYQQYLPTNAVQSPVEAKPWGLKEFFIRDPFRNLILFAEGIPEEDASSETT